MKTAIKKHIAIDANEKEIGTYLQEIIKRIEKEKETPALSSAMHLIYGRLLLCRKEFDKAYREFQASSTLCIDNGFIEFFEIAFWIGKMAEMQKDYQKAKTCYHMALKGCRDNPLFISSDDILDSINNLGKK